MDAIHFELEHSITLKTSEAEALARFLSELPVDSVQKAANEAHENPYFILGILTKIIQALRDSGACI